MVRIPRDVVAIILAAFGAITLFGAYRKKVTEGAVFGLILLGIAGLVRMMMKGPFEIRYYSLIFVFVFLGGYLLLNWQVRRGGGDKDDAADFIIYGVLGVLLGARGPGLACRVQGKAEEHDSLQRSGLLLGLGERGHPPAKRFAARQQW